MPDAAPRSAHTFHIPVMGTGFMIDAPLRVAKYGISSAISLVDDVLIEQIRKFHCQGEGEPYEEIDNHTDDTRARRITAYLNLLDRLIQRQVDSLQASSFEPGSEITRYYEMLPESALLQSYREMLATDNVEQRHEQQELLRQLAVPGNIDVNIMSKADRDTYRNGEKRSAIFSDASAALRGYAESTLRSSIIFSAGINPRLYSYLAEFDDFFPDESGTLKKKIVLKVSDYHSAVVQGRFLAKRGLWVSEYRIESGLNCGGHAFATKGVLLGPILEEFQRQREGLVEQLHVVYNRALAERGRPISTNPHTVRLTVQGGIGTAAEDQMLREIYHVDGTGWGTPFLLVPEVTNVDEEHLAKLTSVRNGDIYLSDSSPFGMPFWNLRTSASEEARRRRIAEGRPGSSCLKGFTKLFNTEFTSRPICTASRQYQELKLNQLADEDMPEERREAIRRKILAKSCICHDLAGGATLKYGIDPTATSAVCCGPNITSFSKVATLEEMVGHIYGRISLVNDPDRPHMFLRELALYIDYLHREVNESELGLSTNTPEYFREFKENLFRGIDYYRQIIARLPEQSRRRFAGELEELCEALSAAPSATVTQSAYQD